MLTYARSNVTDINWGRLAVFAALALAAFFLMTEPAWAAFGQFQNQITAQTNRARGVATTILYAAAALSLLIGVAPMLWGQVKVKWIVTCLTAAVVFALIPLAINAFSNNASQASGL